MPLLLLTPQQRADAAAQLEQAWTQWGASTLHAAWRRHNPGEAAKVAAWWTGSGPRPACNTPVGRALTLTADAHHTLTGD